eukprot:1146057-Pelagomonas_calceolata.AAC.6
MITETLSKCPWEAGSVDKLVTVRRTIETRIVFTARESFSAWITPKARNALGFPNFHSFLASLVFQGVNMVYMVR